MASISIVKKHGLTHAQAKQAADKVAQDLRQRFHLEYRWEGDRIAFSRPGLSGDLNVGHDEVRLDCQLGFLLSALKGPIEAEVHKEFDRRFGGTGTA